MGIVERVDWEDRIPRNIRFMRVRVRVNPWMPVITGFTQKLDDGSKIWIQCKYERVHKLCNRCGLSGHTRSQCTQSMEDVEMMLFCQGYRIQNLHQVLYNFDALEPHFSNNLRAFYNRRRKWTSRTHFSNMQQHFHSRNNTHHPPNNSHNHHIPSGQVPHSQSSSSHTHATSVRRYPDPDTPPFINPVPSLPLQRNHQPFHSSISINNQDSAQATLNYAIHSLKLGPHTTPTLLSSPLPQPHLIPYLSHTTEDIITYIQTLTQVQTQLRGLTLFPPKDLRGSLQDLLI